jgi:hypothetical protein
MRAALLLILAAAAWRVFSVHLPAMSNFTPLMALAFCGGVYFRDRRLWAVPFVALLLSDLYINQYYASTYGYEWGARGAVIRLACFAAALGIGRLVASRRNWTNLLSGALGGSLLFYFVTNTVSWLGDVRYARSAAGWWQALTVGHPEFPPTIFFFRSSLVSDLLFTAVFAYAMERAARRAGQPSLLGSRA